MFQIASVVINMFCMQKQENRNLCLLSRGCCCCCSINREKKQEKMQCKKKTQLKKNVCSTENVEVHLITEKRY